MTTATAWAHLPNAAHIDRILADVRARPDTWAAAWAAALNAARGAAWDAAWDAARVAVWAAARGAAWVAVWAAARGAAWDATRDATRDAAWGAILALIAWDDAAGLLAMPVPAVRLFAAAGDPRAVLLLPAVIALKDRPIYTVA